MLNNFPLIFKNLPNNKISMKNSKLTEKKRLELNEYNRNYAKANPERIAKAQKKFWDKKAREYSAAEEG